ncbi:MAG: hypothetical protein NZ739_04570 [Verrucomicrobiae bacterium]|nr:hypothetical protein [Verrucomicrobiae bacterium]
MNNNPQSSRFARPAGRKLALPARLVLLVWCAGWCITGTADVVVPFGATWRWMKGTNEASTPFTAWRTNGFNDASWLTGAAPFHFGTNALGGDDDLLSGTVLSDMRYNYRCIFMRRAFVLTNIAELTAVRLVANYDDGFVAWINGIEVARANVIGEPTYLTNATTSVEPSVTNIFAVGLAPSAYLRTGTNVLAVQAFNNTLSGSDFRFDAQLEADRTSADAPLITNVSPPPGSVQGAFTQLTVAFNKPVYGVDAADLLIGDQPASVLIGTPGTNRYVFLFAQPAPGLITVSWDDAHGIVDVAGRPFDQGPSNAVWHYTIADIVSPAVSQTFPVAGATVRVSRRSRYGSPSRCSAGMRPICASTARLPVAGPVQRPARTCSASRSL